MSVTTIHIDLNFRPHSYFWPLSAKKHLLSTIKGAARRRQVEMFLAAGDLSALSEFEIKAALSPEERQAFGRIHPRFMGGEYLPDLRGNEIEIARINIDSTTSDVTSVYARRSGSRIAYRIVDEYEGDTLGEKRTRTSRRPLTLGQLAGLFLDAWRLDEVLDFNELDEAESQRFVHPSSEFYPDFAPLVRQKISEWRPTDDEVDDEQDCA